MEFMTKPQEKELNKLANYYANDQSKDKGVFPKRHFKIKDILKMIKNRKKVAPTLISLFKSAKVIRQHDVHKVYNQKITLKQYESLNQFILEDLDMDDWGVATFKDEEIFKGMGIPYRQVIVMSRHMDKEPFIVEQLPNMECMIEVMKVYGDTGVACLRLSEYLRQLNFVAIPNHSLGGNVDYTKAGFKANLGFIGKHGMLITPKNGPCHRLSIVYTDIVNLEEFLPEKQDHHWGPSFCAKCKKCVRTCPNQAIYDEALVDEYGHVSCISNEKCGKGFATYGCAICIAACPFTSVGYDKIKSSFLKMKEAN